MTINPKYGKGLKITGGKADYIKRKNGNGGYEDVCLCRYNIDLSPGCISNTNCRTKVRSATRHNCEYCYARRTNYHEAKPYFADKSVLKGIEEDIIDNKMKYIRLGKKVECGNKENRNLFLKILEIGGKHNIQFIMPTKYLEFNKEVGNLLIQTKSVLGYSIGADKFEDGACSYGYNNKFRLKQAHKYLDYGVDTKLKIVTDITVHPEEAAKREWYAWKALNEFPLKNIQIIPVRIKAKNFAYKATGEHWSTLQSPKKGEMYFKFVNLNGRKKPRYVMEKEITVLIANGWDTFYDDLLKQMCGHIGTIEEGLVLCDKCGLREPEVFPMSDLPPSPGTSLRRKNWVEPNNWKKVYAERSDKKYQVKMDDLLKQAEGEKNQLILKG